MKPDFIIIGSGKSATASITSNLRQHPDLFVCTPREPHYFSFEHHRGPAWYASLYAGWDGHAKRGEASITYTLRDDYSGTAERILRACGPDVKLIYVMRNPVEGVLSHFTHDKLNGHISVTADIADEINAASRYVLARRYAHQLAPYRALFPASSLLLLTYEAYVDNPRAVLAETCRFIGTRPDFEFSELRVKNVTARRGRKPAWFGPFRRISRSFGTVSRIAGHSGLRRVLNLLTERQSRAIEKPHLDPTQRDRLAALFEDDLRNLNDIVGRDMAAYWGLSGSSAPMQPQRGDAHPQIFIPDRMRP